MPSKELQDQSLMGLEVGTHEISQDRKNWPDLECFESVFEEQWGMFLVFLIFDNFLSYKYYEKK